MVLRLTPTRTPTRTPTGFNRPKAISGLATAARGAAGVCVPGGFNRPKAISGLATIRYTRETGLQVEFQSPEGD